MSSEVTELGRSVDVAPDDWREVAVADVVAMLPGFAFKSENFVTDTDAGLPLIRIRDLGQITTATRCLGNYDEAFAVQDGDILVGMDGEFEAVRWRGGKALLNQRVLKLSTARPDAIDEGYLFYRVQPALSELEQTISGTTVKHLSTKDLKRLVWNIPPLDEQRRIAEVLRSVDEAIVAAQGAADHANALQLLLTTDRCFGHGYDMVSLGDIMTDIRYGTSVKCDASEADGHPVLRIPNVVNGRVESENLKYAVVTDADLHRFRLDTGDVVVVRTNGNPAYIGRSALIEDGMDRFLFASYLIRMRFNERRAWAPYVFAALNSSPVRHKLLKAATTSAGNYNINTKSLSSIAIPLPDLKTQHQIGAVIRDATHFASACQNEVSQKRGIKAVLMSNLLSGNVRVMT